MKTITKDFIRFAFDPAAEPAMRAQSGETVCFLTKDCYDEQIDVDGKDFAQMDMKRNNPVTGPLFVEGAEPGDVLKVEVLELETEDHGCMCVRLGSGVYTVEGCHCRRFAVDGGLVHFDRGIDIPVRPMIGVIGTCPAEAADTQSPGEHGGNLDIKDLGQGCTLYLPVAVPGALLSMGDVHAVQGDGETAICAIECSARVVVRVTVLKDCKQPTPLIEDAENVYTTFADPSLDIASVGAARKMHGYLMEQSGLTDAQAAMLLSLAGELRISQVVNPAKGCIMQLPKKYLK